MIDPKEGVSRLNFPEGFDENSMKTLSEYNGTLK